jgi:hypothetical protein
MLKKSIYIFFMVFAFSSFLTSQDRSGKIGMVLLEDFSSDPLNYGFSFWFTNHTSVELIGGFKKIDLGDNSGTLYNFGAGGLYHFGSRKIVPFLGGRFLFSNLSSDKKLYSDLMLGIVFGAEYFFSEWISIAGEFQLNYIETDDKFSPSDHPADASIFKTYRYLVLRLYL